MIVRYYFRGSLKAAGRARAFLAVGMLLGKPVGCRVSREDTIAADATLEGMAAKGAAVAVPLAANRVTPA